MKDHYIVSVDHIEGVTRARMTAFIQDAVSTWGGQLEPKWHLEEDGWIEGDPLGPPCPLGKHRAVVVTPIPRYDVREQKVSDIKSCLALHRKAYT